MAELREVDASEIGELGAVLSVALINNPLYTFLFPDEALRSQDLLAYQTWLLRGYAAPGTATTALTTAGGQGVAMWGRGPRWVAPPRPEFSNPGVADRT